MSTVSAVLPYLSRRFETDRLVFWHDAEGQYENELEALDLPEVKVIRIANNEFAIKHRVLREEATEKFLIYRAGTMPAGIENWLLDLELAHGVFTADRAALVSQDLGLRAEGVEDVVNAHKKFFNSARRVQALKDILNPGDDAARLEAKITAVVLRQTEHSLQEITRTLLIENARNERTKFDAIVEYGLDAFYWRGLASIYGYRSASPSIDDFVLWMFGKAIGGFESDGTGGSHSIKLDFASFRNDRRSQDALAALARRAERDLDYASSIEGSTFRDLLVSDVFEAAERRIISDLARAVNDQTVTVREVADVVRERRQRSVWFDGYKQLYSAIQSGAELLAELGSLDLTMQSFDDGLDRYRRDWFRIDQLYRHFIYSARTAENSEPLDGLRAQVETRYTSQFVYELGKSWQQQVDTAQKWVSTVLRPQTAFYKDFIEPIVRDEKKAVVIISDALRYEAAEELGSRIRQEDRFDAEFDALLGVLPSYTQLGMAALLPHSTLRLSSDGMTALVDDQPSNGTEPRGKILATQGGSAIRAEDFNAMTGDERRELFKGNQFLYIYHNRIDEIGDKQGTERQVFEAVEDALRDLLDLVKKAASANATNIFITADHGFLFQEQALADAFFLSTQPHGDDIKVINRRYILGRGLKPDNAFTTFRGEQVSLDGDIEVQIPKSIHRLRLPGGGSRFVHGGATLQEVVVPVLAVNKKRKSDTRLVEVKVLPESDKITTGQVVILLFQAGPVSDKVQPRRARAGLYGGETLISNQVEMVFDQDSAEQRDRYQSVQLLLNNAADDYNNRQVEFRLEEAIPNTTQWRPYAKAMYTLKRSFASDFEF